MKLCDARNAYYNYSGKLGDINRQICFAGVAIIWIFSNKVSASEIKLDIQLLVPLVLFVQSLACDLMQYLISTITWSLYHRIKEKSNISENVDFKAPRCINWFPLFFFYIKILLCIAAYLLLFKYIFNIINA